jgi:hypothetical protein
MIDMMGPCRFSRAGGGAPPEFSVFDFSFLAFKTFNIISDMTADAESCAD